MAVDIAWNMLGRAPDIGQAITSGFEHGRELRNQAIAKNALAAFAQNPNDTRALNALMQVDPRLGFQAQQYGRQQAAEQTRRQTGQLYASGDTAGATKAAIGSGDFDLASQFMQLDEATQKATVAKTRAAAPVLLQAAKVPYERRKDVIAAAIPTLVAQGWKPEEIAAFDPTDDAIEGLAASAMTVEQVLDSGKIKWVTGEWGAFSTDAQGRPVRPGFAGAPTPVQQAAPSTGGKADGRWQSFHQGFLGPTEGGYADRDGASGAPVNFGVNQKANPDIDVKSLTPERAAQVLHDRYWVASGADQLPPGLAEIHGDTAVNMGVAAAKRLLERSGGDPEKYLQLREARYRSIGGKDLGAWLNRNNSLREYVGMQDGAATASAAATGMPSIQEQAASGVIQAGQKPPPGYRMGQGGNLEAIPGGPGDKTEENRTSLRKEAAQVRQEFRSLPQVKKFDEVRSQVMQIQRLATSVPDGDPGRAQADMALIFSFMKALDPNSVVREQEYATAQNAAGVPERIRNYYNATINGQKLSPEQRVGMTRAAGDVYRSAARGYNEIARQYHPVFKELGVENPGTFAPLAVAGDQPDPLRRPAKPTQATGQIRVVSRQKVR